MKIDVSAAAAEASTRAFGLLGSTACTGTHGFVVNRAVRLMLPVAHASFTATQVALFDF